MNNFKTSYDNIMNFDKLTNKEQENIYKEISFMLRSQLKVKSPIFDTAIDFITRELISQINLDKKIYRRLSSGNIIRYFRKNVSDFKIDNIIVFLINIIDILNSNKVDINNNELIKPLLKKYREKECIICNYEDFEDLVIDFLKYFVSEKLQIYDDKQSSINTYYSNCIGWFIGDYNKDKKYHTPKSLNLKRTNEEGEEVEELEFIPDKTNPTEDDILEDATNVKRKRIVMNFAHKVLTDSYKKSGILKSYELKYIRELAKYDDFEDVKKSDIAMAINLSDTTKLSQTDRLTLRILKRYSHDPLIYQYKDEIENNKKEFGELIIMLCARIEQIWEKKRNLYDNQKS